MDAIAKIAEKPEEASVHQEFPEELDAEFIKLDLIESIIGSDKSIQSHVADSQLSTFDELEAMSIEELSGMLDLRLTYLCHLVDQDTVH